MSSVHAPKVTEPSSAPQSPPVPILRATRLHSTDRQTLRRELASVLHGILAAHGMATATAAERVGVNEKTFREKRHGIDPLKLEDMALLGERVELEWCEARARELRRRMGHASKLPVTTHALRIPAATGDFAREAEEALRDGVVDKGEAVKLSRCAHKIARAAQSAMDDLRVQLKGG
jgi:hypothetical protein